MKKQGFTLIELLAVIVILAIIALIATPTILNVIEKAKKGSAEQSALGYIDAVEKQIAINELDESKTNIVDGVYEVSNLKTLGVSIKGENPSDNSWVQVEKNIVTNYSLKFKEYTVTYGKETIKKGEIEVKPSGEVSYQTYSNGTSIYYNPETNTKCESSEVVSTTGTKTGCMKWYTFNDEGENSSTVNMILDHNTTATVAYNSDNVNTSPKEVATALTNDTTTWNSNLNARLITADEVAKITGNTSWNKSSWFCLDTNQSDSTNYCTKSKGTSKHAWLFDSTNGCISHGCNLEDTSNYGYWTSTPVVGSDIQVWLVREMGALDAYSAKVTIHGIRPVITISKSIIS